MKTKEEPEKNTAPNKPDSFRLERSIMKRSNIDTLYKVTGDRVAESIIQYICYEHQYNIFGYGLLDPETFGKQLGFNRSYLSEKVKKPYQDNIDDDAVQDIDYRKSRDGSTNALMRCDNRIENALFVLGNRALYVGSTSTEDGDTNVRTYKFMQILEEFSVRQDTRTGKVMYRYRLDERFRRNLDTYYQNASINSIKNLRKSGLVLLYLHLVRLRDSLYYNEKTSTEPENTPQFEYLCDLAYINKNQENKFRKRDLNKALKKVSENTEVKFSVEWVNNGSKERYTPLFTFPKEENQGVPFGSRWSYGNARRQEDADILINEIKHNLYEACPKTDNRYDESAEDDFFSWIQSEDPDTLKKIEFSIVTSFVNAGYRMPTNMKDVMSSFRQCAKERKREEFDLWLREIVAKKIYLQKKAVKEEKNGD